MEKEGKICDLQDLIGNKDLNSKEHLGFIIGKGRVMYWYIVWYASGNCIVYRADVQCSGRYLSGDQSITVHFKNQV